ncbi:COG0075 Serine-pyruvate aminotransferase/archaeal aspartate aminotransferase [Flavobacteriaceae bacterium]|jgi:2-aminoethylphosphonate-pyruvate transaminase
MHYKLLTPGPLTTSDTVKQSMLKDWCTWDEEYKTLVEDIRSKLLEINSLSNLKHTVTLLQGSGTYGVESTIISSVGENNHLLVLKNGAYGERIYEIATKAKKNVSSLAFDERSIIDKEVLNSYLKENPSITHVAFVHCETTTGILNPLEDLCEVVKQHDKVLIVDAMSSLGGIPIDIDALQIDFIISSSNKCLQGVPGFSFIISKIESIQKCEGNSTSLSLDLYDQWINMEMDPGKWRFTSPTHVVRAFYQAILELVDEGGIVARYKRYLDNQKKLVAGLENLGFKSCIEIQFQSPIITTFLFPDSKTFTFQSLYDYLKVYGFVIYPGKLSNLSVFRIGNIGDINANDIELLIMILENYKVNFLNE